MRTREPAWADCWAKKRSLKRMYLLLLLSSIMMKHWQELFILITFSGRHLSTLIKLNVVMRQWQCAGLWNCTQLLGFSPRYLYCIHALTRCDLPLPHSLCERKRFGRSVYFFCFILIFGNVCHFLRYMCVRVAQNPLNFYYYIYICVYLCIFCIEELPNLQAVPFKYEII